MACHTRGGRRGQVLELLAVRGQLRHVLQRVEVVPAGGTVGEVCRLAGLGGVLREREKDQPIGIQMRHRPPPNDFSSWPFRAGYDS